MRVNILTSHAKSVWSRDVLSQSQAVLVRPVMQNRTVVTEAGGFRSRNHVFSHGSFPGQQIMFILTILPLSLLLEPSIPKLFSQHLG